MVLCFCSFTWGKIKISDEAWQQLRNIHRDYYESTSGKEYVYRKWSYETTDEFIQKNLYRWIKETSGNKASVQEQVQKSLDHYKTATIVLSCILGVLLLLGIICIIVAKYSRISNGSKPKIIDSDKLKCPRCGWKHQAEETECKNCHTHF